MNEFWVGNCQIYLLVFIRKGKEEEVEAEKNKLLKGNQMNIKE